MKDKMPKMDTDNGIKNTKTKKIQVGLDQLIPLVITIISAGICLVIGFMVITEAQDAGTSQGILPVISNSTSTITDVGGDILNWAPLIVIVVIGAVLLGLVSFFGGYSEVDEKNGKEKNRNSIRQESNK